MGNMQEGDYVKVKDPNKFISVFRKKIENRVGVIEWVGNDEDRQFRRSARVRFLKRNGRGKEFSEIMNKNDLEVITL